MISKEISSFEVSLLVEDGEPWSIELVYVHGEIFPSIFYQDEYWFFSEHGTWITEVEPW
tara:strand:+ start:545 stop:721 length:177 start_codon:yes stop_codon:yes gene_type:complete